MPLQRAHCEWVTDGRETGSEDSGSSVPLLGVETPEIEPLTSEGVRSKESSSHRYHRLLPQQPPLPPLLRSQGACDEGQAWDGPGTPPELTENSVIHSPHRYYALHMA